MELSDPPMSTPPTLPATMMDPSSVTITPATALRQRPLTAPTVSRSVFARKADLNMNRSPAAGEEQEEPQKPLKRIHSDPSLSCSTEDLRQERLELWSFIRNQPEYRRLMWDIKLKQDLQRMKRETIPLQGNWVEKQDSRDKKRQGQIRIIANSDNLVVGSRITNLPSQIENKDDLVKRNQKGLKQHLLTGIRHTAMENINTEQRISNGVAVRLDKFPDGENVSGHPLLGRPKRPTGKRKQVTASSLMMSEKVGIGKITLQMNDFHRPGHTKTMSVNYSSAILSQNSRILSEDLIRFSGPKMEAHKACIKRTERRLSILRKNRQLRDKAKVECEQRKRMETIEGDAAIDSAYFWKPEETILKRPTTAMDELLTTLEKKDFRNDRIKERTLLLPENYRTSNYIKEYGEAQVRAVEGATYLRTASEHARTFDNANVLRL